MNLKDLKCISENINLDEYIRYREEVKENMEHPEWLGDFSEEELIEMLKTNSKIWMYYLNDEFVCSMMLIEASEKALNKFKVDLNVEDVMDYGPMFVYPKFLENKLQYQMLKELDGYCLEKGYKYAMGTIHPENTYCINNLLKDDFINIDEIELKRGIRNVYLKNLIENSDQKIFTFIINEDKQLLLLKGSDKDPQFHESFWYVVTGSIEKYDTDAKAAVKREIKEETDLDLEDTFRTPYVFEYDSLGTKCIEYVFVSKVKNGNIILNEENIDYKWCDKEEFMDLIKWYGSKENLKQILEQYI